MGQTFLERSLFVESCNFKWPHSRTLAARPSTYRGKVHIDLPKVMYSRRLAFLNRVFYDVLGIQMTTVHHFGRLKCRKCCKVVQKLINSGPDFASSRVETSDPPHASHGLVSRRAAWLGSGTGPAYHRRTKITVVYQRQKTPSNNII